MVSPQSQGFTLVEVIVALLVLTLGILSLAASAALVTRLLARGQRSAEVSVFAARRLERLRVSTCFSDADAPPSGADTLYRGSSRVAVNRWITAAAGKARFRIAIVTTARSGATGARITFHEATIACAG